MGRTDRIKAELAKQAVQQRREAEILESIGENSDARAARFRAEQWQKVADGTAQEDDETK